MYINLWDRNNYTPGGESAPLYSYWTDQPGDLLTDTFTTVIAGDLTSKPIGQ